MIKSILKNPIFIISTLLLLIHQIIQKTLNINILWIDSYLDDFLAMPFILSIFLMEQHFWKRRTTNLTAFEVLIFTVVFAIFFEEVMPKWNIGYTKDYWDYLIYGLGSLVFYFGINDKLDTES